MVDIINAATKLVSKLKALDFKITTAESCTGGLVSAAITAVPGASGVFESGFCVYSNRQKTVILNVDPDIIEKYGAVSVETVTEMAQNAAVLAKAGVALAVSGIAGPSGGTAEKPIGTVWTAIYINGETHTEMYRFEGNRESIRNQSVFALLCLCNNILNEKYGEII